MTFFCPICWKEIEESENICPHCDADITEHDKKSFEEKLINALKHPERETVQRAVWILGRLKSTKAVEPLRVLFDQTDNVFLKMDILDALNEIGTLDAIDLIIKAIDSYERLVRNKAKELLETRIYK
jgi:HEAT repeat protein